MLNSWLIMLLAFLRPAVDDPQDPPADPNPQDPPADPDPQPELDLDQPDPDPEPKGEPNAELEAAKREAAEAKERATKFEREALELRVRHAPPAPNDLEAQENARLADPKTTDLEKWQINSNRAIRQNTSASQAALMQAQDVADRTAFATVAMADPLAKKYETRVEEELVKARQRGQFPRREDIYTYMLGRDMREGKFKKKAAPANPADPQKGVNRGKLPGARSDVPVKGQQTERDKRRARLENVQI